MEERDQNLGCVRQMQDAVNTLTTNVRARALNHAQMSFYADHDVPMEWANVRQDATGAEEQR